jgi:hypothetical protein
MKFYNPTRRKEKLRCPKRFYYRYLYKPDSLTEQAEHSQRGNLYGIRELGGYLVHQTLAKMITSIADGSRWDYDLAGRQCRNQFMMIVAKSLALEPGQWEGGLQLAETFNGLTACQIKDDVTFWRDSIPGMIENGYRAAYSMHIGHANSERLVESEKRFVWKTPDGPVAFVVDVMVRSKIQTICVDWKCHAIDNADFAQVRFYLDYLRLRERIDPSRLFGFAVDLLRGEIRAVPYKPYKMRSLPSGLSLFSPGTAPPQDKEKHPARPHPDLCVRCPYAAICPSACGWKAL